MSTTASQTRFSTLYASGKPFTLIDTRERREYVSGHWFGSINMPLSVLTPKITRMVADRGFPIYLLDAQDEAGEAAAAQLSQLGYHHVTRCQNSPPEAFGNGYVKGEYDWSKALPVILFDHGSGSRAAFAAYWLSAMGFSVSVVYLQDALATLPGEDQPLPRMEKSLLFAGRHHGNMQDSRDYLAWEEELPEQIDPSILDHWHQLLGRVTG